MSQELAKLTNSELKLLANLFLDQINERSFDPKKPHIYQSWFNVGKSIHTDIPDRSGYFLGFHVVKLIAQEYELQEMVRWDIEKIHSTVMNTLNKMSH